MSQPPRKFAVEPIETTSKSSRQSSPPKKDASPASKDTPPPRRFGVEPVETLIRSSKHSRPNSPETGDLKKPPRRFAPEPVETKRISSRDNTEGEVQKPRKFAPVAVETSQRSNRQGSGQFRPPSRFAPVPVETTYGGNRKKQSQDGIAKPPPRKFQPILLDTATRSRRNRGANAHQSDYKTESGHLLHAQEHRRHITGTKTPAPERDPMDIDSDEQIDPLQPVNMSSELRRQLSPLSGRRARGSTSSHSFRLPELDTIESSESDRNSDTSPSSSPGQGSPMTGSDSSFQDMYKQHASRIRESIDENFAHYLLQLEAKKAQQRLEEAALAAFPNSDFHEPVAHYVDDEDSDEPEIEDRPVTWEGHDADVFMTHMGARRESTAKITWEQLEMQRHAERLEQERNAAKTTAKKPSESPSPWWNPAAALGRPIDPEMKSMQDRARPPMLGDELVFPRCPSPEPARFDVTQGSAALRNQMMHEGENAQMQGDGAEEVGLWQAQPKKQTPFSSIKSPAGSKSDVKGLWGGFCLETESNSLNAALAPPAGPTGLMTPWAEPSANPFDRSFAQSVKAPGVPVNAADPDTTHVTTPPTPPVSIKKGNGNIDAVLEESNNQEASILENFPDSFITQVYNYLSIGYPSLARPFDEELAKISGVSIAELREDDKTARKLPRGYIRLGPDFEGHAQDEEAEGVTEQTCKRWKALKLYIHEWARQESDMVQVDGQGGGNWGTGARRGSWAI